MTLTLKFLFKAFCPDILTNAILRSIFLEEEAKQNLNKEIGKQILSISPTYDQKYHV